LVGKIIPNALFTISINALSAGTDQENIVPEILDLTPAIGPRDGGSNITLSGTDLDSDYPALGAFFNGTMYGCSTLYAIVQLNLR